MERPFIYRDNLHLWVGCRGDFQLGVYTGFTLCGKIASFSIYPELFRFNKQNLYYFKYGSTMSDFFVTYKEVNSRLELPDFSGHDKTAYMERVGSGTVYE